MPNQLLRGLIFIILVFLVTSDLKEIISTLTASSSITGAFIQRHQSTPAAAHSSHQNHQRVRRRASTSGSNNGQTVGGLGDNDNGPFPTGGSSMNHGSFEEASENMEHSPSGFNDNDSLDHHRRLNSRGQNAYAKRKLMKLNEEEKKELLAMKTQLTAVMQEWCLPKLVCELHASVSERGTLTEAEKGLLSLIRETSLGTMGEVVSRYHFAAHMGQLISGVEGNGCHNFYPNCPLSGSKVLQMMKKVRIR